MLVVIKKNLNSFYLKFYFKKLIAGGSLDTLIKKNIFFSTADKKLPQGFCKFYSKLQTCPDSSTSLERVFSLFGLVWSKIRNRLSSDKAQKLVKIYRQ